MILAIPTLIYLDLSETSLSEFAPYALNNDIRLEKLFMQGMPYLYVSIKVYCAALQGTLT